MKQCKNCSYRDREKKHCRRALSPYYNKIVKDDCLCDQWNKIEPRPLGWMGGPTWGKARQ